MAVSYHIPQIYIKMVLVIVEAFVLCLGRLERLVWVPFPVGYVTTGSSTQSRIDLFHAGRTTVQGFRKDHPSMMDQAAKDFCISPWKGR